MLKVLSMKFLSHHFSRNLMAKLGPVWISIEPTFTTGRRVLGIHLDPSAGLQNANSGTLGCIGLVNRSDMLELAQLIERSGTDRLEVLN